MMEHKLKLKFDDSFNGVLFSTQGDTGRVFEIEVRDELDNAIDITGHKLEFYVGNDSKVTKVEAEIQGSKFIVKPVNEQFTKSGLNKAQFVLYDPQGLQVGSQIFDLHVEESIQNGATVGRNVIVDFSKINEAVELIKGYEKTFEDSKNLDTTLSAHIDEGKKVNQELVSNTSAGRGLNENLKTSTTKASEAYTKLEASRTGAGTLNNDLKANIASGNKTNANLQSSISTAKNTQNTLQEKTAQGIDANTKLGQSIKTGQDVVSKINTADKNLTTSITNANTAKTNLDASVAKANTAKTNLDASIDKANTAKTKLDESTSQGNATDSKLKDTDTKAGTSISTLQDLLNQSATTEQSLKDIIASGNLDKYITEPKLQEALAKIKTLKKEVVEALPATGQDDVIYLVKDSKGKANNVYLEYLWINNAFELIGSTEVDLSGYAKTSEVDDKISKIDLSPYAKTADINNKLNSKVDKIESKGLSSNDYTDEDKNKLDGIDLSKYVTDDKFTGVTNEALAKADEALQMSVMNEDHIKTIDAKAEQALINSGEALNGAIVNAGKINALEINVADQMGGKANRTEIKTKLSEMTDDSTHRLVTDAEKTKWNSVEELTTQEVEVICNEILK
ncbi:MAG: BppU family phage baseplate upper protein [Eubacteriales bacterium]|uniref:BppU family phage baseplate upper protein n=1 Tax=Fenollaria sp. TaxID=1965292 RepID=UPI002A75D256|nr:BppU family phage baseplate upper protein [Fenollaria sp.]MDD7339802.1 BppU family phage baseplate upper protein [Eubacteriales bacterium]MDY3106302.1 BppU family phage baseplate upper protein [Fenollaria sp.]